MQVVLAEVRAMRADNAKLEGRVLASLSAEVATIKNLATGSTHRDVEAEQAKVEKVKAQAAETQASLGTRIEQLSKHRGWAIMGVVALFIIEVVSQYFRGDVSKAAETVSAATAKVEAKEAATELVEDAVETKADATELTTTVERVAALEERFTTFETKLDDLLERLPPPAKPKKGPR
jgi:hypothetical protein